LELGLGLGLDIGNTFKNVFDQTSIRASTRSQ